MWNMRIDFTSLVTGAIIFGASATFAVAQQQPTPFPWEKNEDRFFGRTAPKIVNPIDKRIEDGLKSMGLPGQPKLDTTQDAQPLAEPPGLSQTIMPRMDTNRDGEVSRQEYMLSRQRPGVAGSQGTASHVRRYERLDSRFRAADRNGDGKLSGPEIDAMKGRRF
jgi:hypothetical protein